MHDNPRYGEKPKDLDDFYNKLKQKNTGLCLEINFNSCFTDHINSQNISIKKIQYFNQVLFVVIT
jgi:hypothetical protein